MSTDADTPFWPPLLAKLMRGEELTADEAGGALATILEGRAAPSQIAGFAIALRAKGETPAEMAALVRTMLAYAERVDVEGPLLDTCGTGGDRSCSINVSTLAALVAAGAGARVAKHGNRSATSACGSGMVSRSRAMSELACAACSSSCFGQTTSAPSATTGDWPSSSSHLWRTCTELTSGRMGAALNGEPLSSMTA